MNAAAAQYMNLRVLAAGFGRTQMIPEGRPEELFGGRQIQYSYGSRQGSGGEIIGSPLPDGRYGPVGKYDGSQPAIAETMIAADVAQTAGLGQPAAFRNLDQFATAISGRGMGFRDPQLSPIIPGCEAAAARYGIACDCKDQSACRQGWPLDECASAEGVEKGAAGVAHCESSLQMVAYRINASDEAWADARRAMCVGFLVRSLFAFFSQLPHLVAPKTDLVSPGALGTIMDERGDGSGGRMPAAGVGGRADD